MRLGYQDKTGGKVYEFKKKGLSFGGLFNINTADYAKHFFSEIEGLGNVYIVKIKGNKLRRIASRTF